MSSRIGERGDLAERTNCGAFRTTVIATQQFPTGPIIDETSLLTFSFIRSASQSFASPSVLSAVMVFSRSLAVYALCLALPYSDGTPLRFKSWSDVAHELSSNHIRIGDMRYLPRVTKLITILFLFFYQS